MLSIGILTRGDHVVWGWGYSPMEIVLCGVLYSLSPLDLDKESAKHMCTRKL